MYMFGFVLPLTGPTAVELSRCELSSRLPFKARLWPCFSSNLVVSTGRYYPEQYFFRSCVAAVFVSELLAVFINSPRLGSDWMFVVRRTQSCLRLRPLLTFRLFAASHKLDCERCLDPQGSRASRRANCARLSNVLTASGADSLFKIAPILFFHIGLSFAFVDPCLRFRRYDHVVFHGEVLNKYCDASEPILKFLVTKGLFAL